MRPVDDSGSPNQPPGRGDQPPHGGPPRSSGSPVDGSSGGGSSVTGSSGTGTSELAGAGGFASRPPRPPRSGGPGSGGPGRGEVGGGPGTGRHRRDGELEPDDGTRPPTGPGRRSATGVAGSPPAAGRKKKRRGSFWRELPLLIVVALVLTFVIQTFVGRIYVIPSASMEKTLHGCSGCVNDRVAVDKLTYRFSDPTPGDVVVFKGPESWASNDEVPGERSDNVVVRGLQQAASLIGLAPPDEKDFVKRVVAVGGQTVACCDDENRVTVDGRALTEPYIYYQPQFGDKQAPFDPITVPPGQLWVMGDNRNNSSDARAHGPIGVTDVIGKARAIVLPVNRWSSVPDTDPQAQANALGAPVPAGGLPLAAGLVLAVPTTRLVRRRRGRPEVVATGPIDPGPGPSRADRPGGS